MDAFINISIRKHMGFSTTNRNTIRPIQPKRRLVPPPPIRRNIPQPQMSRPLQLFKSPTGLPQQISAPTGMPNVNQPPLGLPNIMQQPTGLPPTQTQMPTPPAVPVEQSSSLFAPPIQQPTIDPVFQQPQMQQPTIDPVFQQPQQIQQPAIDPVFQQPQQIQQPTIDPVFQQPQMQQPVAPQQMQEQIQPMTKPDIYGGLTPGQALGGEYTMQQPAQQNQRDPQYIGMPDEMYASMIKDMQMNNGYGPMDMMVRPWQQWSSDQQTTGPIAPSSTSY